MAQGQRERIRAQPVVEHRGADPDGVQPFGVADAVVQGVLPESSSGENEHSGRGVSNVVVRHVEDSSVQRDFEIVALSHDG